MHIPLTCCVRSIDMQWRKRVRFSVIMPMKPRVSGTGRRNLFDFWHFQRKKYLCILQKNTTDGYPKGRTDTDDEAVLRPEGEAPRRATAVPLRRLLRDLLPGCRGGIGHTGHHADEAQQWRGESDRDGGISPSCAGYLSAQTDQGG